jgi:nucleotide-binding universal stress UspA family protein
MVSMTVNDEGPTSAPARILCALDLSEASDEAVRQADRQARLFAAQLTVLHVLPTGYPGAPMSPPGVQEQMLERDRLARQVGDAIIERVGRLTGRTPRDFAVSVEEGDPGAEIVRKAQDVQADLVVVSALGATGLPRVIIGRVAERVVRHAHASVLVARPSPASGRILVATDFSALGSAAVTFAAEQARRRTARLVLMHSLDLVRPGLGMGEPAPVPPAYVEPALGEAQRRSAHERLARVLEQLREVAGEVLVSDEPAPSGIPREAERLGLELVVVGTHGRTGLRRLLLGSVAEAVVRRAPCSVLVVRSE